MENNSSDEGEIGLDPEVTENIDTGLADHIEQLEEHVDGSMGVSVDDGSVSRTNSATGPEVNEPTNQTGPLDTIQEDMLQELGPAAEQASPQTGAPSGAGTVPAATVTQQRYDAMKADYRSRLQSMEYECEFAAATVTRQRYDAMKNDYRSRLHRMEQENERLARRLKATSKDTEPSTSPPVVYKVVYKTSKSDPQWQHRAMKESKYDDQKVEDSESVIEMRKEGYLSQKPEDGKDLHIASLEKETMNIHSPYLMGIMAQAIGYYPASKLAGSKIDRSHQSLVISKPYRMLGGALPRFKEIREQYKYDISEENGEMERDPEERKRKAITIEHIELLEHELNKVLEEPLKREKQGYLRGIASFDMLWLLFRPGTIVYTTINDEPRCCMVLAPFWTPTHTGTSGKVELRVRMWFLDFNGSYVDRRSHSITIDSFEGTRNIRELGAYPTIYMDVQSLCDKMIKRGEKYMRFLRQIAPQCQYRGFVFTQQGKDKEMKERHFYDGKVVVDPVFDYMRSGVPQGPWLDKRDVWPSETSDGSMIKFVNIDPRDSQDKLENIHFQLLTCYIRGFTLGTRRWVWLRVDELVEYNSNELLLQKLAINSDQMRWMKALVPRMDARYRGDAPTKSTLRIDPIGGKGEGQVMLLHGPPGTGKTFTAECIAEYTGRPLLRLSCGELGLDPTTLEEKLSTWFRMAEEWQGVLLIDEADVYLQQRSGDSTLEKETIVAVFLRALEYYRGILFLTSNCVIKFDEAITSRTSLIIEFKNLETHERAKLRDDHRRKIELDKRYALQKDAHHQLKLMVESKKPYNGREINNVFQMALALATEDAKEIDREREANEGGTTEGNAKIEIAGKHIEMVMDSIEGFMAYQESRLCDKSRDQVAQDELWR